MNNTLVLVLVFPGTDIEKHPWGCVSWALVCIGVHTPCSISFKEDTMPGHLFHLIKPLEKIRGVFSCGEISSTGNGFQKHLGNIHNTLSLNAAVCIFFIADKNDKMETACLKAPISYI